MCHAIYGIGLIAIRMRERYKGGVRGHKNEGVYSWQKTASSSVDLGWLSALGRVMVEWWSWVRILLDIYICFFSSSTFAKISKLFGRQLSSVF